MQKTIYLTPQKIKQFEQDQKNWGTKTALFNVLFGIASDIMHAIGNTHVHACDNKNCKSSCDKEE